METTRIWDSRNNRHATVEHETLKPCPFCDGMPRIDDDEFFGSVKPVLTWTNRANY